MTEKKPWTVDLKESIGPQLHRILRERIIQNDLCSGSKISEPEIARVYSVSRQPVREAFIKLSEEGLVEIRPQRGTVVRKIESEAVLSARFVREAIEADIVKILAVDPDPSLIKELRGQLSQQDKVSEQEDIAAFTDLDERFHRTLATAAGQVWAWDVIQSLRSQMDRVRFLSFAHFSIESLVVEHRAIVDQIEGGSPQGAEQAMRTHLKKLLDALPELLKTHKEFFEDRAEKG